MADVPSWLDERTDGEAPAASTNDRNDKKNWRSLFKKKGDAAESSNPSAPPANAADMGLEPSGIKLNMGMSLSTDPAWATGKQASSAQQRNVASMPDDGSTPAWALRPTFTAPVVVPASAVTAAEPSRARMDIESGARSGEGPKRLELDTETINSLQRYQLILRGLYFVAAVLLGAAAGLSLIGQTDIGAGFFAIYIMIFATLMCCFEVGFNVRSDPD